MKTTQLTLFVLSFLLVFMQPALSEDRYPPLEILSSTTTSVIGQKLAYPSGQAKITAAIITMQPGSSTGWHKHNVPLFAYLLEGQLSVDYGINGIKIYKVGDSFIEAFQTKHNGTNSGQGIVRILAVFAGSETVKNTEMTPQNNQNR